MEITKMSPFVIAKYEAPRNRSNEIWRTYNKNIKTYWESKEQWIKRDFLKNDLFMNLKTQYYKDACFPQNFLYAGVKSKSQQDFVVWQADSKIHVEM